MWKKKRVIYKPHRSHYLVPKEIRASDEDWKQINALLEEEGLERYVGLTDDEYEAQKEALAHQRLRDEQRREFWISFKEVGGKLMSYCALGAVIAGYFYLYYSLINLFYTPAMSGGDVFFMLFYIYLGYRYWEILGDCFLGALYGWKHVRDSKKS